MKRIFPIITILILLSLLGLIFFQFLWIKSAREAKDKQVEENIGRAMQDAAEILTLDKSGIIPMTKKSDILFPGDKLQMQYFKSSVLQRFTREEISDIIRRAFNKNNLQHFPFEFAVSSTSITGDQLLSENYYKLYSDSANNMNHFIPLLPPSGSSFSASDSPLFAQKGRGSTRLGW